MRIYDIIQKKRDREALTDEEIRFAGERFYHGRSRLPDVGASERRSFKLVWTTASRRR
jgi:thymidine phosphorylase